jgi:hypothetical protein
MRQAFEYHDRRETLRGRERLAALADPGERIRDVLAHELGDDPAVREGWVLWSEMQRLAIFHEPMRASVVDRSRRWVASVAELIRGAQAAGGVASAIDADAAALRLTALVDGLGGHVVIGAVPRSRALGLLDAALGLELGLPVRETRP